MHPYITTILTSCLVTGSLLLAGCSPPFHPNGVYVGVADEGVFDSLTNLKSRQKELNYKPRFIQWECSWEDRFPTLRTEYLINQGILSYLVWTPRIWDDPEALKITDILKGDWDAHIQKWASSARDFQFPLLIEFAPEGNRRNSPWSIYQSDMAAANYAEAFRYLADQFQQAGASNVQWIWSLTAPDSLDSTGVSEQVKQAYPGADYVDWLGVADLVEPNALKRLSEQWPNHPVMITSLAPSRGPAKTAEWVSRLPQLLANKLSTVRGIVWPSKSSLDKNTTGDSQTLLNQPIFNSDIDSIQSLKKLGE